MIKSNNKFIAIFFGALVILAISMMLNIYFYLRILSFNAIAEVMLIDDFSEMNSYFSGNTVNHMSNEHFAMHNDPEAALVEMDKCDIFVYQLPGLPARVLIVYVSGDDGKLRRVTWVGL